MFPLNAHLQNIQKAAVAYYDQHLPQEQIARLMGVTKRTIGDYLKQARDLGVVHVSIDGSYALEGTPCPKIGENLKFAFGLDPIIVVKQDGGLPTLDPSAADDRLHICLANNAGGVIDIENGNHVGVSGGRAVYRTVQRISRRKLNKADITVSPLCGRIWAHSWRPSGQGRTRRPVDSDDCAFVLAQACETAGGTSLTQIGMPLYANDSSEAERYMQEYCMFLPGGKWKERPPNVAIVGCGSLNPSGGHRMTEVIAHEPEFVEHAPYLRQAADDLRAIILYANENGLPPPGDVANRLFCALPLPDKVEIEKVDRYRAHYRHLNSLIRALNNRSVVVDWKHLRGIPVVWCVAGGASKLDALWTLCLAGIDQTNSDLITALATDSDTGEALVRAHNQLRSRKMSAKVKEWYKETVRECFADPELAAPL